MTSACSSANIDSISSNAAVLAAGSAPTGTHRNRTPCHSTNPRRSSWLEITHDISHSSSPLRQRYRRSATQWSSLLANSTTRFGTSVSLSLQSMPNSDATGSNAAASSPGPNPSGRLSATISIRRKNRSVARSPCCAASRTDPPRAAIKPVTAATMPTRSGHVMVRM